ncbi:hypothetical protein GCK32_021426, partial [Trichostrongylus colubriformis]
KKCSNSWTFALRRRPCTNSSGYLRCCSFLVSSSSACSTSLSIPICISSTSIRLATKIKQNGSLKSSEAQNGRELLLINTWIIFYSYAD